MTDEGSTPPPPPPEVEQAAMLGHIEEAVSLYMIHTDVDEATARAVVTQLAEG
jgi:hypothetical protein